MQLRARGARLALCARTESRLRQSASSSDLVVAGDLTDEDFRRELVARTTSHFGRIDALININNAGRGSYFSALETPLAEAHSLFELNFFAPFHLAQLAAPSLKESGGSLVNVNSIAGQISLPWLPLYSAGKFALGSLTSSQRAELRRHGVHVMSVFPGYVSTDFQQHAAGSVPPETVVKGKRFAVSAGECAAAIIRGMDARRNTVVTPRIGWPLVWFNRIAPAIMESRMGQI
jgi:short-subunit dehydrogenase